jgi:hypothetical protein
MRTVHGEAVRALTRVEQQGPDEDTAGIAVVDRERNVGGAPGKSDVDVVAGESDTADTVPAWLPVEPLPITSQ